MPISGVMRKPLLYFENSTVKCTENKQTFEFNCTYIYVCICELCMHDLFRTLGFPLTLSYSSSSSYLFIICADTTPLVQAQSCILSFLAGIPKEKLTLFVTPLCMNSPFLLPFCHITAINLIEIFSQH